MKKFYLIILLFTAACAETSNVPCTRDQMISDQVTRIIGAAQGVVYAGGC